MAYVEDLSPYFLDFGVDVTVGAVACRAIFDNGFATTLGFSAGSSPMLILKAADVPSVAQGDAVTVAAGSYTVVGIEPDGTGLVLLRLQEA